MIEEDVSVLNTVFAIQGEFSRAIIVPGGRGQIERYMASADLARSYGGLLPVWHVGCVEEGVGHRRMK